MFPGQTVFFAQAASVVVLLVSTLLVYHAYRQRYLVVWSAGWVLYLAHMAAGLNVVWGPGLVPDAFLLAAQAVLAAATAMAAGYRRAWRVVAPVALLALAAEAIGVTGYIGTVWPARIGYLALALMAALWMCQYARRRPGIGPYVLCAGLLLRGVHFPDFFPRAWAAGLAEWVALAMAMGGMLVLALESMRQHLRWSAAPGLIASLVAEYAGLGRLDELAPQRIADEIRTLYDAGFARFYLRPPKDAPVFSEPQFLLSVLPRAAADQRLCSTVLGPERGADVAAWLREHALQWAVIVPVFSPRITSEPSGLFVLGYRSRRWLAPELMESVAVTARQFGILLENSLLLQQLSHAYRDWLNTVDAIDDLILVHDTDYRILRVNQALAHRVGTGPAAIVQRLCRDVLPHNGGTRWHECPFCESPAEGDTFDEDFRGYFLVSTYRYAHGGPAEIQHVVKDITDRKLAEEKYRTLFEKVHEGVFVSSRDGRFLDANEAIAQMLGYEREELFNLDIAQKFYSSDERQRYLELMDAQGYVRDLEVKLRKKDGEPIIALETSLGVRDESGRVVQFQGFLLDITARKQAEEKLQQHVAMLSELNQFAERLAESLDQNELIRLSVTELRRIFGADTAAAYRINADSRMVEMVAWDGFQGELGGSPPSFPASAEFISVFSAERRAVIPLNDLPPLSAELLQFRRDQRLQSTFIVPLRGEQFLGGFTLTWRSQRALNEFEQSLLGTVGRQINAQLENAHLYQQTRRAYDELRRAQEQLLHSEKMAALGQLVSGVAHELNNPLTAIIGYSQLLTSEVTERGAGYVEKLLRQAQRTNRIIQNLLSFSRQHKPERRTININEVIEETLVLRDFDMQVSNIRLERQLEPGLPSVSADVHQLEQVFLNVINNACDALKETPNGFGRLRVRTYSEGLWVIAEFIDNGPGLREPARVFDPFYTTKSVGKGTGLGLSICYGIVKEHGGEITAENTATGGAAFRIRLPAAELASSSTA